MRFLLFGPNGQLGTALKRTLAPMGEVQPVSHAECDLSSAKALQQTLRSHDYDVIVNAAAHTRVDQAESDESSAMAVNAKAPEIMATEARGRHALLVHYSTDYVFDGSGRSPYTEDQATAPLGAYGRSKLAGEEAIRHAGEEYLILRTAWLYSNQGQNFLNTMLRVAASGKPLRVVDDQIGSPTFAGSVAQATADVLQKWRGAGVARAKLSGVYHMTCAGATSWYDFARRIFEMVGMSNVSVSPIASTEYPTPARRPTYSVLSNDKLARVFGVRLPSWQDALRECLAQRAPGI